MTIRLRVAAVAVIVTYDLFSTTNFHDDRAYLVIVLAALAVTPCGRELSVDAWLRRWHGRCLPTTSPGWPLWLLRIEAATVAYGRQTRRAPRSDWAHGTVTWQRLNTVRSRMDASSSRGGRSTCSPTAPSTHAVCEVRHRHRAVHRHRPVVAAPHAVGDLGRHLHVAMQLSADVEVFSYLALAALVISGRAVDGA